MKSILVSQFCDSSVNLTKVLSSIVWNMYKYPIDEKFDLQRQFGVYFERFGWESDDVMTA